MGDYIAKNPNVIEGFGRAMVRATRFTMDQAKRAMALTPLKSGGPKAPSPDLEAASTNRSVVAWNRPK